MANKHQKKCLVPLAIREMKTKATVKCLLPSTSMVTIKKKGQVIKSVDKDTEKLEPSYAGGWTVSYLGKHSGTSSQG